MKINLKSLKTGLLLWYLGSLLIIALFFYIVIHILALPYGIYLFIGLLTILAILGLYLINRITGSLTYLSSRMKLISSKNLDERILDIKSKNEIGELAFTFNNLLDRLNDAFKREKQFIADVAHELKTPLAILRGTLEVAQNKTRTKEEYAKVIDEAIYETTRISSTLKNILDLAWLDTPYEEKNKKRFNLSELMEDLYEITQKMSLKKKINVEKSIKEKVYFSGFREKIAQAVLNLIDNAIKYSKPEGKIELILETSPSKILVSVIDSGQGILKEDLPYIFNRFYRGSKTDKVFGSGLGLAIAKSIIVLHKGEIKVKSNKGKGSAFIIVLPLSSD
ncbi:sensor histidine kinase [Candidatus Microgenomates bacterium]|nr:MAG: sensor histidine kinase [Candidatus Microgenomates bacterium]